MTAAASPTVFLALTIALLAAAPLIFAVAPAQPAVLAGVDGFAFMSVGALVLLFLIPHSLEEGGGLAVAALALGIALPLFAERLDHLAGERGHGLALLAALAALGLHAAVDGVGLTLPPEHGGSEMAAAIAAHRLPVGLAVWWLVRPAYGARAAAAALLFLAVATAAGFTLGGSYLPLLDGRAMAVFTAFVAGALLHVVAHRPHGAGPHPAPRWKVAETLGAALGAAVVVMVPHADAHGGGAGAGYLARLTELALEAAPALLVGYALSGLVVTFLPQGTVGWLRQGTPLTRAARGVVFGLPIPVCSCGVVPVYEGLVRRGVPATAALAFLVATPELGLDSVLLSLPLLGAPLTIARVIAAAALALGIGWWVGRRLEDRDPPPPAATQEAAPAPLSQRLAQAARYGLTEVVDDTAPWILFGLAIAAAVPPAALSGWLASVPHWATLVMATLAGMPIYVCASGATLAAALIHAGLSPGAALAFLLSGPATNITTFGVLSRLHGPGAAWRFGGGMIAAAVALGFAVDALVPLSSVTPALRSEAPPGLIHQVALAALLALVARSVLAQGPRGFVSAVLRMSEAHPHDDHDDQGEREEADGCCGPASGALAAVPDLAGGCGGARGVSRSTSAADQARPGGCSGEGRPQSGRAHQGHHHDHPQHGHRGHDHDKPDHLAHDHDKPDRHAHDRHGAPHPTDKDG